MSLPWFADSTNGSTRSTGPTRSSYLPPHLRFEPNFTVTIPSHFRRPRQRRSRKPAEYFPSDMFDKFDDLELTPEEAVGAEAEKTRKMQESPPTTEKNDETPVEATGVDIPPLAASFAEMGFSFKGLIDNIKRCKYVSPTPIQRHAIPVAMAGRDLMACAQTGSGKTAAFCFPIINGILANKTRNKRVSGNTRGNGSLALPVALILAPTRELACQIHEEAKKFSYQTGVKVVVAYGGAPIVPQLRNLERGVDILVATPGRLVDMIERGKVTLRRVKYLALDEADRMLDMGFERQVRKIVQQMEMPPPGSRQTMLFSATFPAEIQSLASVFLSNYIFLAAGKVGSSTNLIVQKVEFVSEMDKRECLVNLLHSNKSDKGTAKDALTLVFVETKRGADALERWLSRKGFPSTAIHGDKVQMERERALKSFRSGLTPILVATDVAARGLDIPHVAHVINFDLPRAIDNYVHRIGRTGRAGKSGLATAFFCEKDAPIAKSLIELMQEANQEIPPWLLEFATQTSHSGGGDGRSSCYGGSHDYRNGDYSSQCGDPAAAYSYRYAPVASTEAFACADPYTNTSCPMSYSLPYAAGYSAPIAADSGSYICAPYAYSGEVAVNGWE